MAERYSLLPVVTGNPYPQNTARHAAYEAGRASIAANVILEGITRDDTVHGETYFTAADMASAAAQGFRDGVASVAASAGGEPVAHLWQHGETGRTRVLMPDMIVDADASWRLVGPLFLGSPPSPPEGMVGGWISVKERLPPPFEEVVVYPRPDDYCCEAFCDTAGKWKWAEYEHNFGVHHRECQVEYWLMLPEVPAPPTTSAGSGKGD